MRITIRIFKSWTAGRGLSFNIFFVTNLSGPADSALRERVTTEARYIWSPTEPGNLMSPAYTALDGGSDDDSPSGPVANSSGSGCWRKCLESVSMVPPPSPAKRGWRARSGPWSADGGLAERPSRLETGYQLWGPPLLQRRLWS
jgi:hypothetical protein